ncbi:MAG TPA: hypothetical protein VIK24_03355, partial [Pyrinomonadaceae bacterium]
MERLGNLRKLGMAFFLAVALSSFTVSYGQAALAKKALRFKIELASSVSTAPVSGRLLVFMTRSSEPL